MYKFGHSYQKMSQNTSKSLVCHRIKGVFYPSLGFYTLDLWPCQPSLGFYTLDLWPCQPSSTLEACDVADVILKRNKVWKRYRDSLKIRNVPDRYLHCTEQPPQHWYYPPTVLKLSPQYCWYPPLYWTTSTVLKLSPHSTEAIPPPPPPPHTHTHTHCTEQLPQYCSL